MCEENKCAGGVCGIEKGGCGEKSDGCGHSHKHMIKWLVKIIVLALVFCFAFQMGEMKGTLNSYGRMHRGSSYGYGPGMMYGNSVWGDAQAVDGGTATQVAPATPTK